MRGMESCVNGVVVTEQVLKHIQPFITWYLNCCWRTMSCKWFVCKAPERSDTSHNLSERDKDGESILHLVQKFTQHIFILFIYSWCRMFWGIVAVCWAVHIICLLSTQKIRKIHYKIDWMSLIWSHCKICDHTFKLYVSAAHKDITTVRYIQINSVLRYGLMLYLYQSSIFILH